MPEDDDESKNITRRQFLKYVVIGGAGLVAAAIATPLAGYFLSPTWRQKETVTLPIARADSIPVGTPTLVRFEQRLPDAWEITTETRALWVVTKDGQNFTVFDPHCTHLNCPYDWNASQQKFLCPCHGGVFDIDGRVLAGPPPRPLDRWESFVSQGEIEVTGKIIRG